MKPKRLLAAVLCAATLASGTISANAASPVGTDHFTDGEFSFQRVKVSFVNGIETQDIAYVDNYYETFSGGYLLVSDQNYAPCYLGEDGTIHDLNRGRFATMHPFSEGLAAVIDDDGKVGYIDTTGQLVIPCQFDAPTNQIFSSYTSKFWGGKAWVFRESENSPAMEVWGGWAQIDTTGKLLTDYSPDAPVGTYWMVSSENIQKYNLFCLAEANAKLGWETQFPEVCTAPGVGEFTARFGNADVGLASVPTGKYIEEWPETLLYIVKRQTSGTRNLSTYMTTGFETINPLGYFDAIASEHRVNYKLENTTAGVDQADIAIIPCVLGGDTDWDGRLQLVPDRYYPITMERIERTLQPGEVVRSSFRPHWGFEGYTLKYVVIKLEPGDMELLHQNGIGEWTRENTYDTGGRTKEGNQRASDFIYEYFSDYLK